MGIFDSLKPDVEKLKAKGDARGLIRALRSRDVRIRRQAVEALGEMGAANAVNPLVVTLIDDDRDVRLRAAEVLEKMNFEARNELERVTLLIAKRSWSDLVRLPVSSLIEPLAGSNVFAGISLTENYIAYHSICVISALQEIGQPAVPFLIAALEDRNKESNLRGVVAGALGAIGDARSIAPLIKIFRDKTEAELLRKNTAIALHLMGVQVVDQMLATLRDKKAEVSELVSAANILMSIGKPAVEGLISALSDERPRVRAYATIALAGTRDPRAIAFIHPVKNDKNEEVRQIAHALLQIIGEPSLETFVSLLKHNEDTSRLVAAAALGNTGNTRSIKPLWIAACTDKNASVRTSAFISLGKMMDKPEVRAMLIETLSETHHPEARLSAALILLKSGVSVLEHL